jgi:hypothetical protein
LETAPVFFAGWRCVSKIDFLLRAVIMRDIFLT